MKRLYSLIAIIGVLAIFIVFYNCKGENSDDENIQEIGEIDKSELPLNITVYLDLSDRLIKNGTETTVDDKTQFTRDTTIISQLEDIFIKDCMSNNKLLQSKNHFQVVFYPAPNTSKIYELAADLNIDLNSVNPKEKRKLIKDMKQKFSTALSSIYQQTIQDKVWTGSDIWGFFSNKKVDNICIREGYRNVLVILTDGYLYHVNNKINEGNSYSYILDQTLQNDESSLLVKRKGLEDLEVLMLEINPSDPKKLTKMTSVLETWFNEMGVNHFVVADTDIPQNIKPVIDSFFNN